MRTYTLDGKKLPLKGDVKPACETCRFFKETYRFEDEDAMGQCLRRAPVRDGWPGVNAGLWCGEYEEAAK